MKVLNWIKKSGFGLILIFLIGCHTIPETGRTSLNLVPEKTVEALSASSFAEMKEKGPLCADKKQIDQVERVGRRIAKVAASMSDMPPPQDWDFVVFQNDENINAFAMPGGKVGVYTGLLKVTENDDQLAAVLGHEVAHVAARHGNERLSRRLLLTGVGVGLAVATMNQFKLTKLSVLGAYGVGSTVGVELPFSRREETEADHIGLIYMARAGYDPRQAVVFWENMTKASANKVPEFLSTHPSHDTRIERLEAQIPSVMPYYEAYKKTGD